MKDKNCGILPSHLRLFAWLNIGIQTALPLAAAFTPAIASASHDTRMLAPATGRAHLQTRPYTLTLGETVTTVSKKFNISLDELRKLNQLRTFAHGFDALQPGDELDVPLLPLPVVPRDNDKNNASPENASHDTDTRRMAGIASQAGTFLSSRPDTQAASALARDMATGHATAEVQQWLSQFGTARVGLAVDDSFSLKNSRLDMLVPLHDAGNHLLFTQGSLHRTDDRAQSNLGLGMRWFNDGWMAGANTFFDYDISRGHMRAGVGAEYWRDYLKLSANGYLRLSD